jgi:phosphoserine phosphatase
MKYKIVAFDMDGTLIKEESCWWMIHQHFGTEKGAARNLETWARGEIDYPEFMRRDIQLWQPVPHISQIEEILSKFTLAPNAAEVVAGIHQMGGEVAIVTGGIDLLANRVARKLGIEHVLANGLEVDERGYLTGEGIFRVDPLRKHEALERLTKLLGLSLNQCVAVGDSKWDVNFLRSAGLGVAIGSDAELGKVADVIIRDFDHFGQLLNYL